MLFRSYRPGFPLSSFIENFWLYEGYASREPHERIFPSGTVELVFNLLDDELRIYRPGRPDGFNRYSGAVVSGPYSRFFSSDSAEEASVIGVHFKPGGAFPFLGPPPRDLADSHIELEDIWGSAAGEIRERLCSARSPAGRFRLLENLLVSRLRGEMRRHSAVAHALEAFQRSSGRSTTRQLACETGLSEKRLIDLFRFEVGMTPKLFGRIQRFQRVLSGIDRNPETTWTEIALTSGYFDQSHLIRDFLAFSGVTPADYWRRVNRLRTHGSHIKFNHLPVQLQENSG